jgi:hypothetical protein
MKKYQFKTTATMKPYNNKKWWIDSGYIHEIIIEAENIENALQQYREIVRDNYGAIISDNGIKNKQPLYRDLSNGDALQVGFVITAKTDFNNDYRGWVTQYINLWVSISLIQNAFMEV